MKALYTLSAAAGKGFVGGLRQTQAVGDLVEDVNVAIGTSEGVLARSPGKLGNGSD